jgi:hypothetical protein
MNGLIRKIVIGKNPKDAMAYWVGMVVNKDSNSKVSAIMFDERSFEIKNRSRYFIYLQEEDGSQVLWKAIDEMPCIVEFDLNF